MNANCFGGRPIDQAKPTTSFLFQFHPRMPNSFAGMRVRSAAAAAVVGAGAGVPAPASTLRSVSAAPRATATPVVARARSDGAAVSARESKSGSPFASSQEVENVVGYGYGDGHGDNDGYDDGCPYVPLSGDGEEGLFGVDAGTIMLVLGGLGGLLIVGLVLARLLSREDDEDDDYDEYDEFYDDDEEEESFLDRLDRTTSAVPQRSRPAPQRATQSKQKSSGPSSPPPSGGGPSKQRGQTSRAPSGPSRRTSGGPPGRGPSKVSASKKPAAPQKASKKKVVSDSEEPSGKKVRKAKINVDLSIFEDWQAEDRDAAVDWVAGALAEGDQERTMLMQLQETGWTAEQSRAICNLAKNKRD